MQTSRSQRSWFSFHIKEATFVDHREETTAARSLIQLSQPTRTLCKNKVYIWNATSLVNQVYHYALLRCAIFFSKIEANFWKQILSQGWLLQSNYYKSYEQLSSFLITSCFILFAHGGHLIHLIVPKTTPDKRKKIKRENAIATSQV